MLCMCSLWPHARELRMCPFSLCCYRYHYQGLCLLRVCCFQLPTQCTSVAGEPTSPLLITEFKSHGIHLPEPRCSLRVPNGVHERCGLLFGS